MVPHGRGGGPPAKPALTRGAVGAREQPRPQDLGGVAIAVRCVVRAPPKTSLVVRRAGAAQDESGGGRISVQSFSTSMGIYVGTSFQRTQGPPATPCPPRSKQRVNGTRIVELQAGVRPPFSWSAACLLVLFFWRAPSMAAPMARPSVPRRPRPPPAPPSSQPT